MDDGLTTLFISHHHLFMFNCAWSTMVLIAPRWWLIVYKSGASTISQTIVEPSMMGTLEIRDTMLA
jgi:hypothetical protein